MPALTERKIAIVRALVETAPDAIVGNLQKALAETTDESALGGVRRLVETEIRDRTLRNTILRPVAPMFVGGGNDPRALTFPSRALALLWRGLKAMEGPAIAQACALAEEQVPAQVLMASYDNLVAIAAANLRARQPADFRLVAEICDHAQPNGAETLVNCLEISAVVRRSAARLTGWLNHPGDETSASARLAYKDAVAISDDAGPRFFEMLAAQLPHRWMVLRVISAVMDKPTERYLADSELADFGEEVLQDIDDSLAAIGGLDPDTGPDASRAAAERVELIVQQIVEIEASIDLQREHGWGKRVHKQRTSLAAVVEGRLREAEKFTIDALPMHAPRQHRGSRSVPRLGVAPDERLIGRARTLLSFSHQLHATANYGGFSAVRAKLVEKLSEFLLHYVEDVLDLLRDPEAEDLAFAGAFLETAAEFSQLLSGAKAGELVRRRARAALQAAAHSSHSA